MFGKSRAFVLGGRVHAVCVSLAAWLLLAVAAPAFAQDAVNTATITAPAEITDPDTGNNSATDSDPIVTVSTSKSSDPASGGEVAVGDTITYTLSVAITGGATPVDVVLTDTLSANQTLSGALPAGCSSAPGAGDTTIVTCTLDAGASPAGSPYTFTYSATVDVDATGTVDNSVVADVGTCTDCSTSHPVSDPTVTYNKTADTAGPVSVGDTITYTLTATVSDAQLVDALVLTDTLGTGLTLGTVTANAPFACNAANPLECTLPAGTVPGTYTVTYAAEVNDQATGTVNNAMASSPVRTRAASTRSTWRQVRAR